MATPLQRLQTELRHLERLAASSNGVVDVTPSPDLRQYRVVLRVNAPIGSGADYTVECVHGLTIDLTDDFPAAKPLLQLDKPVLAPNIWPNGVPCIVDHNWSASMHLDQVVCDLIEEMQGINPNYGSVANEVAANLYLDRRFVERLRQQLGPPVLLVPAAAEATPQAPAPGSSLIVTISSGSVSGAPSGIIGAGEPSNHGPVGIRTVGESGRPASTIVTVR